MKCFFFLKMWRLTTFFTILVLVTYSGAIPKKHHGTHLRTSPSTKTNIGRLPVNVIPKHYLIELVATEDHIKAATFSGSVAITVNVTETLKSFLIHARDISIIRVALVGNNYDGTITWTDDTEENDLISIRSDTDIKPGDNYVVIITYMGALSLTDMDGFYQSTYLDIDGIKHYLATTQFKQMGARRAFPCFDEPVYKATFDISIIHSSTYNALSNTEIITTVSEADYTTTTFKRTPEMSTYLVAFIVSEFNCTNGAATENGIPTSICGRISTEPTMALAADISPKALNAMNHYTGINYKDMGIGKMTQAAIPDFAAGAMENWGMVTYRETDILFDTQESSNAYKQTVVEAISHAFAHQWFGDKVTLDWWSDVFLNEGFATYFEYHAADQDIDVAKDWELTRQFVVDQLQTVLVTDSVNTSLPLSLSGADSNDVDKINSRFDDISYNKGGSILRMVHHLLGLDNFKTGLTAYLNLSPIGTPEHLWESLNASQPTEEAQRLPDTLVKVMDNWTNKAGYPCLTVALADDGDNITITQAQFLMTGTASEEIEWYVPVTYTKSNDINFTNTATQAWLVPGADLSLTLDGADWIILNNQQIGYYRVNYDDTLLGKISTALNSANQGGIDAISRSQIIDDQLNFARASNEYGAVLGFLGFLKNETSYYAWSSAFNGFSYLLKRTSTDAITTALKAYISGQMGALLASVPITVDNSDLQIYTLKQVMAHTWACKLGNSACITEAKTLFDKFVENATANSINPNLRSIVYCFGLRNSDNATAAYEFLYKRYKASNLATEKVTILRALGCVDDSDLRLEYLGKALSEDVRLQDARYVFSSVYSSGPEGVEDVLRFISTNYANFYPHFGTLSTLNSLIYSVTDVISTDAQLDALYELQKIDFLNETVTDALNNVVDNFNVLNAIEESLATYFYPDTNTAVVTPSTTSHSTNQRNI